MTESTYSYINLDYMDLMADGDQDMKKTMLEMLLEELPDEVGKIITLSESKDLKTLKAVSHKLKSTLAFVGYELMDKTNKEIERIAHDESDLSKLSVLAKDMGNYCTEVLAELRSEFSKL